MKSLEAHGGMLVIDRQERGQAQLGGERREDGRGDGAEIEAVGDARGERADGAAEPVFLGRRVVHDEAA
ncbi:MAG TPA: hypothetical protein VHT04_14070 [Stellaceae bacterium]|nr:hypothetical protein [Stellaceae bacterium]